MAEDSREGGATKSGRADGGQDGNADGNPETDGGGDAAAEGMQSGGDGRLRRLLAAAPPRPALAVAGLAGLAGVAGSYGVAGFGPGFVVDPVAALVRQFTPAVVITYAILWLGDLGSKLHLLGAVGVATGLFAAAAVAGRLVAGRVERGLWAPTAAVLAFGVAAVPTRAPLPSLAAALSVGGVVLAGDLAGREWERVPLSRPRRRALGGLAAAAGVGTLGYARGSSISGVSVEEGELSLNDPEIEALLAEAGGKSLNPSGTDLEPLVSTGFYTVDIAAVPPRLDPTEWTLSLTGAVSEEVEVDYRDIVEDDAAREHRFVSLRCVGESLNGRKLDTALWTGVPMSTVLEETELEGDYVVLHAADGYYEEFPVEALREGFLAYGMNGEALPRGHGYPVRALIPGHWGEINVKWLTRIEIVEDAEKGYWEKNGWHGTGPVKTVAKLYDENVHRDGDRITVAGHAYAGVRGISGVQVSTDGGDTWAEAELSEPLPGRDVWRQYVYRYDHPGEDHEVVVRAVEADGTVQPSERMDPFPSGAGGWVRTQVGE